ncbi:SET domain-containing protein-lysine N-methyltransferase [Legionella jordanis]|uniref:SET domain protein n=1 Tax=Legionella jordanis TaxID=456 RepID=A0A0W0VA70_9GAMM|nr:SET domain-containing protein-lysine N-methyltransferase [Legionella jordanis]KTD17000.1 SET domain protein [Legionella jordanis]RMX03140.1 SET domain-containing protein [Legionella jordanis]RMX18721.1 SET domain-containing protein [Legionella jordanis]VEH12805.1 SET domain [Legionella jordanis]
MVRISLSNHNSQSPYKTAVLDLSLRTVVLNNHKSMGLDDLKKNSFFHPLLSHPVLSSNGHVYEYKSKTTEDLLNTAKYIYATLIQASDPKNCHFKINSTDASAALKINYRIPLSLDSTKRAKRYISINQLNGIISEDSGFDFHFCDTLLMQDELSFADLPQEVNGDDLFISQPEILGFFQLQENFQRLELRYINPLIGFGGFSREKIKKNEPVAFYLGVKTKKHEHSKYYYGPERDCLLMGIDAQQYGNTARFFNHAPNPEPGQNGCSDFLRANLSPKRCLLNGIELVLFTASRDIVEGEQLFFDYGLSYYDKDNFFKFNLQGRLLDENQRPIKGQRSQKMKMIRLMARHGVEEAMYGLFKRPLIALAVVILIVSVLRYVL